MSRRDGYIVDVPYPLHFYKEMQPVWLDYVVRSLGCVAPDLSAPYRYCELGCGAGINLLVAAACNPLGRFTGVDFNKEHIAAAQSVARQAGIENVEFIEASFDDFAQQKVEGFDYIVSHGVWSWLPPKAKTGVLRIIHDCLNPQGILYLHYMCYPGAARLISLQKVLHEVSRASGASSGESIAQGLALLRKLADSGAGLFVDNPEIEKELRALEQEHPDYLAHEFLTDFWQPEHSADVHRLVSQTGLNFLGSANIFENMDALSIPGNVQPTLAGLQARGLRETLKDVARNQNQRTDVFQKQPRAVDQAEYWKAIDPISFQALPKMPAPGDLEFNTPIGKIPGPAEIFAPLLSSLRAQGKTIAELRALPVFAQEPGLLLQALHMLMWAEYVHPMRADAGLAQTAGLRAWVSQQKLPLQIVADCGTATRV